MSIYFKLVVHSDSTKRTVEICSFQPLTEKSNRLGRRSFLLKEQSQKGSHSLYMTHDIVINYVLIKVLVITSRVYSTFSIDKFSIVHKRTKNFLIFSLLLLRLNDS